MHQNTRAARRSGHLSRHERQRLARANALSRRSAATSPPALPVKTGRDDVELIDWLVRRDRTAVSTALLAIAGLGAGEGMRQAVVASIGEASSWAVAEGAISPSRAEQIARHVRRAVGQRRQPVAA